MVTLKQIWGGLKEVRLRSLSRKGGKEMQLRLQSKEDLEACAGLEMVSFSEDETSVVVREGVKLSPNTRRLWDEDIRSVNPPPSRWENFLSYFKR